MWASQQAEVSPLSYYVWLYIDSDFIPGNSFWKTCVFPVTIHWYSYWNLPQHRTMQPRRLRFYVMRPIKRGVETNVGFMLGRRRRNFIMCEFKKIYFKWIFNDFIFAFATKVNDYHQKVGKISIRSAPCVYRAGVRNYICKTELGGTEIIYEFFFFIVYPFVLSF